MTTMTGYWDIYNMKIVAKNSRINVNAVQCYSLTVNWHQYPFAKKRIPHKMFCFCLMLLLDVSCVFMVAKQQSEDRICFISRHRNKYSRNINKKQLLLWHMPISNNSANMRPYLFLRYEVNLRRILFSQKLIGFH